MSEMNSHRSGFGMVEFGPVNEIAAWERDESYVTLHFDTAALSKKTLQELHHLRATTQPVTFKLPGAKSPWQATIVGYDHNAKLTVYYLEIDHPVPLAAKQPAVRHETCTSMDEEGGQVMSTQRINQAIAQCNEILKTSPNCAVEIDLLLGALARHPDWTSSDIMRLQRQLVLDFAHQLCEQE